MADTIYAPDPWAALAAQHSDIRREQAIGFGETKYAISTSSEDTNRDILTTGAHTSVKIDEAADKIQQRAADFFISEQARDFDAARDLADIRVQVALGGQKTSTDVALAAERAIGATALAQAQTGKEILESKYELARQISNEGDATRALIQSLKNDELNRLLIERNTDVNHFRFGYWDAVGGNNNAQFASVASQLNAFQSQLQETRQGMVNFGTMAGVGQSSANNAVR